jgi:hypothetical protein
VWQLLFEKAIGSSLPPFQLIDAARELELSLIRFAGMRGFTRRKALAEPVKIAFSLSKYLKELIDCVNRFRREPLGNRVTLHLQQACEHPRPHQRNTLHRKRAQVTLPFFQDYDTKCSD